MVVVTSIRHTAIAERSVQRWRQLPASLSRIRAEVSSNGQATAAEHVLDACCPSRVRAKSDPDEHDAVVRSLGAGLRARGFDVAIDVGTSHLRCDIAVRTPGAPGYQLGVLVDTRLATTAAETLSRRATSSGH